MTICYLDAFSGLSGDMLVGALADAGADTGALTCALESLGTGASFRFEKIKRRGIAASKFHVEGGEQKKHRHLPHILEMIDRGGLPPRVRRDASAVFRRLGEAEARVHGVAVEKVHFHEAGAVDSIADIVGACMGLALLNVDELHCSPVNVGGGTVETEHGTLPVPAPATAVLLEGRPVYSRGPAVELTTPTGAAVATALAASFGPMPPMTLRASGFGAGDRDFPENANVLRAVLGESRPAAEATTVTVIEANIDDSTPEILGYAMERLFAAGALDVTFTAVAMKKNRPGTLVTVIARPEQRDDLAAVLFAETSTLGLRMHDAERRVQAREIRQIETPYGAVRIKFAPGGNFAPEYEDCRRIAAERGIPLKEVLMQANLAFLNQNR